MAVESEKKVITLKSSDGEEFEIKEDVAMESQTIRHLIEDNCANNAIPLPNVNSKILSKVIEYCKKHVESKAKVESNNTTGTSSGGNSVSDQHLKTWDADFVQIDQGTLIDLILAANYLNIEGLLDLTCKTVADMFKGKTPEQIRETFHIENDFTPEEEAESAGRTRGPLNRPILVHLFMLLRFFASIYYMLFIYP